MWDLSVDLEVHHVDEEGGGNQENLGSDTAIQVTKPNQTKPNQTKPNQSKPKQTKPNQTNQSQRR